jgi:hypothetical protein
MAGKHMTTDQVRSTEEAFSTARALDLALEALELNNDEWKSLADSGDCGYWNAEDQDHYKQTNEAITAIKQARLAPECTRSHPHENMDAMCELRTEIARLRNENERVHVENRRLIDRIETIDVPPAAPVVPDVLTTAEGEHPEYVQGWNDCRQLMLQTRKNK